MSFGADVLIGGPDRQEQPPVVRCTIVIAPATRTDTIGVVPIGGSSDQLYEIPSSNWEPLWDASLPVVGAACVVVLDHYGDVWLVGAESSNDWSPASTVRLVYTASLGPANDSFETNTTGWATSGLGALNAGATLTRITSDSVAGSACCQIDSTIAASAQGAAASVSGRFRANVPYVFTAYMRGNVGGESVALGCADAVLGHFEELGCLLTTTWKRYSLLYTPSVDLTNFYIYTNDRAPAAANRWFIDCAQVLVG